MKSIIALLSILTTLCSCSSKYDTAFSHDEKNSVYYWKTVFEPDSTDFAFIRRQYMGLFEPSMDYWEGDGFIKEYDNILYDYKRTVGHEKTEESYENEVKKALDMLQTDEAKAEAEYILGNLATIVKRYGNTIVAQHIRTSCDNWQKWL